MKPSRSRTVEQLRGQAYLTVRQFQQLVPLSRGAIHAAIARGELPSMTLGRRRLIAAAPVLALAQGAEKTSD